MWLRLLTYIHRLLYKTQVFYLTSSLRVIYDACPIRSGSYGSIYNGFLEPSHQRVAIKITHPKQRNIKECNIIKELQTEPEIIHMWCCSYHGDTNELGMVLDLCAEDLFSWVQRRSDRKAVTLTDVQIITKWLLIAIKHCHAHNIVHSDVKLGNIGLVKYDDIQSLKLLDFGASFKMHPHRIYTSHGLVVSPSAIPPEIMQDEEIKGKDIFNLDIWGIGVVVYAIVHLRYPFNFQRRHQQSTQYVVDYQQLKWNEKDDRLGYRLCCDLISKLLEMDYTQRITIEQALMHPFLSADLN